MATITALLYGQQEIASAREKAEGTKVTISGRVTNGSELGEIRYLQDQSGGIAVYFSKMSSIQRGDSITVTGLLKDYYTLLEIDPVESVFLHSSDNPLPEPVTLTPSQFEDRYEGMLVRVDQVEFNTLGAFERNTYTFKSGGEDGQIYINSLDSPLIGVSIPTESISLIGVLGSYRGVYQLLPRDVNDLVSFSGIHMIGAPLMHSLSTSGFVVDWSTDQDGTTEAFYGFTPKLEKGVLNTLGETLSHSLQLSGLDASQLVYMQAFSVREGDTAKAKVDVFMTRSESGGEIKAFFNRSVDHSVSLGLMEAIYLNTGIDNKLIEYINQAEESIDFALYNINNNGISNITDALNRANSRGVTVRIVYDGSTSVLGLASLSASIGKIASPRDGYPDYGIMHNKFVVFDANSSKPDRPLVWTGSTNFTEGQIHTDPNNVITLQDQSLARAYAMEFNEMFGSEEALPDPSKARFGPDKLDNTPHQFIVNDKPVECYFSPSDGTHSQILRALETADESAFVATMLITKSDIGDLLAAKNREGVDVKVLLNNYDQYGEPIFNTLKTSLREDLRLKGEPGIMHHKYMIVDQGVAHSNPLLLTGSHNWSSSAQLRNDENTLIIFDQGVANAYYQEFVNRFAAGKLVVSNQARRSAGELVKVYPNPTEGQWLHISASSEIELKEITLLDLSGRQLRSLSEPSDTRIRVGDLQPGIYLLQISGTKGESILKKITIL